MIENDFQYRITQHQALKFEIALRRLEAAPPKAHLHPLLQQAEIDGVASMLEDLRSQMAEYESRQASKRNIVADSLDELPQTLVQARRAAGLTQQQLAERLGLTEQEIQEYEDTNYATANLTQIIQIAKALGIQFSLQGQLSLAS